MPPPPIDFDTVREIALALPGVVESTLHGAPSLRSKGKLLACPAIHRSAEPGSLAVRMDRDLRTELMAEAPDIYYVTDHYVNHAMVLVRMARIDREALAELLKTAWRT